MFVNPYKELLEEEEKAEEAKRKQVGSSWGGRFIDQVIDLSMS